MGKKSNNDVHEQSIKISMSNPLLVKKVSLFSSFGKLNDRHSPMKDQSDKRPG